MKKILSLILVCVLFVTMVMPASAANFIECEPGESTILSSDEVAELTEAGVLPMIGATCQRCLLGEYENTTYEDEGTTVRVTCKHKRHGVDEITTYTYTTVTKCNDCGYSYKNTETKDVVECHGW